MKAHFTLHPSGSIDSPFKNQNSLSNQVGTGGATGNADPSCRLGLAQRYDLESRLSSHPKAATSIVQARTHLPDKRAHHGPQHELSWGFLQGLPEMMLQMPDHRRFPGSQTSARSQSSLERWLPQTLGLSGKVLPLLPGFICPASLLGTLVPVPLS